MNVQTGVRNVLKGLKYLFGCKFPQIMEILKFNI